MSAVFADGRVWKFALCGYALAALFLIWPEIDIAVASIFCDPALGYHACPLGTKQTFLAIHKGIRLSAIAMGGTLSVVMAIHLLSRRRMRSRNGRVLVYLVAALIVGPVLIVNVVLKDNWGRARPYQLDVFNRDKTFTPALVVSDQCGRNCSFVSGDVSLAFYLTAFAFVARHRRWRRRGFAVAIGFGVVVAGLRVATGAHFLSDVIFAALITIAVNWALYRWVVERRALDARNWLLALRPLGFGQSRL